MKHLILTLVFILCLTQVSSAGLFRRWRRIRLQRPTPTRYVPRSQPQPWGMGRAGIIDMLDAFHPPVKTKRD